MTPRNDLVLVRGAGRLGTAAAHRLRLAGFPVVMTEAARPTLIHRRAAFGAVIEESEIEVEGVPARRASGPEGLSEILGAGQIPVLVDPAALLAERITPWVVVDATGLERNVGTRLAMAPIVLAFGPGFSAGVDAHAVIEARPTVDVGRFTTHGALRDDAPYLPGARELWSGLVVAPIPGRFEARTTPGTKVAAGDPLGVVGGRSIVAPVAGVVAGLLSDGLFVGPGMRLADVDPVGSAGRLESIDPLARAAAGGVLEALLYIAAVGGKPGQSLDSVVGKPQRE